MKNLFLVALAFGAVAVSGQGNKPPAPVDPVAPPVPAPPAVIKCPTKRSECSDEHVSCQGWSVLAVTPSVPGDLRQVNGWMEMKNKATTTAAGTAVGQCAVNPDYMMKRCSQSCCTICNTCPGAAFTNPGNVFKEAKNIKWLQKLDETITPELFYNQCQRDKHSLCGKWADEGECEDKRTGAKKYVEQTNHLWMHVNCMSSCCPGCPKSCPASKDQCTNVYSDSRCVNWSRAGECTKNPTWMKQNCANECCETCQPVPVPLPAPRPVYQQPYYPQQQRLSSPYSGYSSRAPYNIYG